MKNKLYICEHNVVISPKNQCIDCNYEDLREALIKGGLIVDYNKQKINQQSLNKKPKMISDFLIETLTKQNNEFRKENIKLGEHNAQLEHEIDGLRSFITKSVEGNDSHKKDIMWIIYTTVKENDDLKNKISELEDVIFNLKKENKYYKARCERLIKENKDLNETISNGREENKRFKSTIERLRKEINGKPLERDYKDLEDKYNKLFQLGLTNTCEFATLNTEHEIMKKDYIELLSNKITGDYKLDKLESEHNSLIGKYIKMEEYSTWREKEYNKLLDENRRINHLKNHNDKLKVNLNDNYLRISELVSANKELSNELEQSKKLFTKKRFISLGFTMLVIYLVIQFTLFLA